ncbi:aspartic peptidase domain-containing protein [Tuber brumale]|nr:aspartic peptidase domain-containing protein [Tuber brumale]
MAPSIWKISLLLLHGFLVRSTLAAKAIHVEFSKPLADNSTDDFLFPLIIGENDAKQTIYLAPSTNNAHTFAISPKACTPPGNNTVWPGCVKYRGGVFDPTKSSFKAGSGDSTKLNWKSDQYTLFADGIYGQDSMTLPDKAGDVQLKDFEIGLVDACNMTSGFLGLGPNSTLLGRLYKDGKIESRSYGLHVGIDITNHPYPVFDPTFDTGEKPKGGSDYDSGIGKRSRMMKRAEEEKKPREVHSFAGGLTLGGYDKSRIDNRTASLTVPLSADGLLELELTELIVVNSWMVNDDPVHDLFNETRKVIIDSSTPHMYLPDKTADALSYSMEAYYGDPMMDFFYGSDPDRYLGNVTFTLQAPGGSESIKIVVPPSVFQQPIGMLRDYQPVGDGYYDYYMPIKPFKASSKQPIILGRSFLKAAYIFVNHERKNFHISQVAYTEAPHEIISISASDSGDYGSSTSSTSSGPSSGQNPPEARRPPVVIIAGGSAGGAFIIALIAFLIWRRRNKHKQTRLHTIPSNPSFHENELEGSHALVQLPANSIEKPPVAASSPYSNDTKAGWNTHPQQGYHEMESNIGTAVSPYPAYGYPQQGAPGYAELATPPPAQQQQHQYQAGSVQGRYEMM